MTSREILLNCFRAALVAVDGRRAFTRNSPGAHFTASGIWLPSARPQPPWRKARSTRCVRSLLAA